MVVRHEGDEASPANLCFAYGCGDSRKAQYLGVWNFVQVKEAAKVQLPLMSPVSCPCLAWGVVRTTDFELCIKADPSSLPDVPKALLALESLLLTSASIVAVRERELPW